MANWKYRVRIKDLLRPEKPTHRAPDPARIGMEVAERLREELPKELWDLEEDYDNDLVDIIEAFENITGYDDVTPVEEFNDVLNRLYEWGDAEVPPFDQWPPNNQAWLW